MARGLDKAMADADPQHRIAELEREVAVLRRLLDREIRQRIAREFTGDLLEMGIRAPRGVTYTQDGHEMD